MNCTHSRRAQLAELDSDTLKFNSMLDDGQDGVWDGQGLGRGAMEGGQVGIRWKGGQGNEGTERGNWTLQQ